MPLVENLKELKKMLTGIGVDGQMAKYGGLEFFDVQKAKAITDYVYTRYGSCLIFLHHFYQAAIPVKISNLLICFSSFDLSSPICEKVNCIKKLHIILS